MTFSSVIRLLLLLVAVCHFSASRQLTVEPDGRFVDLLVSISASQPEDPNLIERVKEWLRSFSSHLSVATRPFFANNGSLRLGRVSILVPKNWSLEVDAEATWQSDDVAHVKLGRLPELRRTYLNGSGCGGGGKLVAFDVGHVMNESVNLLGKQLLQEFARFRWGVFSEHNEPDGPHFYFTNGKIFPVYCTNELQGKFMHNITLRPCKFDRDSLEMEPNCRFFPSPGQDTRASLMSTTDISSVTHFCQNSSDSTVKDLRHNDAAPNLHNRMCRGMSVSQVMQMSQDFKIAPSTEESPIEFQVVRPQLHRKVSIVMDISGSMRGNKMNKMITAMDYFVNELLEPVSCSLVTFTSSASILKRPALLNSREIRREFGDAVTSLTAGGGTNIGSGVNLALQLLEVDTSNPKPEDNGYIVLLSDGMDGSSHVLNQAAAVLRKTSIFVDTIAFGTAADKRMLQLSTDSGGIVCFVAINSPLNDILECLNRLVNERVSSTEKPITLYSGTVPVVFSIPVLVDETATNGIVFSLNTYRASDIVGRDLKVSDPNGTVYDKNSVSPDPSLPIYSRNDSLGIVTIRLRGKVQSGVWLVSDGSSQLRKPRLSLEMVTNSLASVSINSKSSVDEPIVLTGSVTTGNFNLSRDTKIVVTASLMQGPQALKGAKILAKVESDSGTNAVVWLTDDGVEPDSVANDAVHSAFIPLNNVSVIQEYNVRLMCEEPVNRVTTAGKFVVTGVDAGGLASIPPATVQDLRVRLHMSSGTVALTWTAVGDTQNEGMVARYEVKAALSPQLLRDSFDSAETVAVNVEPLAAGSQQTVNASVDDLPNFNATFFVAIRGVNLRGIASGVSNVESLQLRLPDNIVDIEGTTELPDTTQPSVPSTTEASVPSTTEASVPSTTSGSNTAAPVFAVYSGVAFSSTVLSLLLSFT